MMNDKDFLDERAYCLGALTKAALESEDDPEGGHGSADRALVRLLKDMGFDEIVEAYEEVDKWYA